MLTFHLRLFAATLAVGVLAGLLSAAIEGSVSVLWVLVAALAAAGAGLAAGTLRRRRLTYTITTRRLVVRVGLLSRELYECRLDRVQNVSYRQSLLERALAIGTVSFETAGESGFDFTFAGVEEPGHVVRAVDRALGALGGDTPCEDPERGS